MNNAECIFSAYYVGYLIKKIYTLATLTEGGKFRNTRSVNANKFELSMNNCTPITN